MIQDKYSIHVNEEEVLIFGELTIREAFDFLSFYEREGYTQVTLGQDNSTLRILKDKAENGNTTSTA